jgi:dethiobiotin synthetase
MRTAAPLEPGFDALAVVGTDTGVGKTVVAAGLIFALRLLGLRVSAFKPIETGLAPSVADAGPTKDPSLEAPTRSLSGAPADWVLLGRVSNQAPGSSLGVAYRLPAAPLAASEQSGRPVDWSRIEDRLRRLRNGSDRVVVEGAGGLMVPVDKGRLWADVLVDWQLPVLVVGRLGLGTINHTLLTLEALRLRCVPVLGVLLNAVRPPGPEAESTPATIRYFTDFSVFSPLAHGTTSPAQVAAHLHRTDLLDRIAPRTRSLTSRSELTSTSRYKNGKR